MNTKIHFRVAGIAIHDGHILLHRSEQDDFWSLPGGSIEWMEAAAFALVREMQEELAVEIQAGQLLYVIENFFPHNGTTVHEMGLYFQMHLPAPYLDKSRTYEGMEANRLKLLFRWFPVEALPHLLPECLNEVLKTIPENTVHLVNSEL